MAEPDEALQHVIALEALRQCVTRIRRVRDLSREEWQMLAGLATAGALLGRRLSEITGQAAPAALMASAPTRPDASPG